MDISQNIIQIPLKCKKKWSVNQVYNNYIRTKF